MSAFPLSLRNVEDPSHERGIDICHESSALWVDRFGLLRAQDLENPGRSDATAAPQWAVTWMRLRQP